LGGPRLERSAGVDFFIHKPRYRILTFDPSVDTYSNIAFRDEKFKW
jgi:hypothetical protein